MFIHQNLRNIAFKIILSIYFIRQNIVSLNLLFNTMLLYNTIVDK